MARLSPRVRSAVRPRRHGGFTLVELLVVIAVITILLSLLMPAVGRARAKAVTLNCMSNMRQVGQAFASYLADNKGMMPTQYDSFVPLDQPDSWAFKLMPYVGGVYPIFACTNNTDLRDDRTKPGISYLYNGYAAATWGRPTRVTKARAASESILMSDHGPLSESSWIMNNAEGLPLGYVWWYPHTDYNIVDRPGDSRSVLFADFHVEQVPANTLEQWQIEWPYEGE